MELGVVDRITADAVGEPGMRTFYLQARAGEHLVTVIVEKEQVELLARSVLELATDVPPDVLDDAEKDETLTTLEDPVDPRWRAGRLSIGFDDEQDRFLLEIDEYVPAAMPTNRASARSFSGPVPSTRTPTISSAATGSSAVTEVLIERTSVWLTARFARSAYVRVVEPRIDLVFSRTLSNTTTVS